MRLERQSARSSPPLRSGRRDRLEDDDMSKRKASPEVTWHSVAREAAMTGWGPTLRLWLLTGARQRARLATAVIVVLYGPVSVDVDALRSVLSILRS